MAEAEIAIGGLLHRLRGIVRLCCVRHFEAQHADHLPIFGEHLHLPAPCCVAGEVLFVSPGAVAFLASAVDIEGDAVDLFAVEFPHMVDPLIQPARRIDGGVGVQPAAAQLGGVDLLEVVAWRAILHLRADSHFGHPQRGGRHPTAQEPAGAADGGRDPQQHRPALEAAQRQAQRQAWNRQRHGHAKRQLVTLGGGQVQDDRQRGQQCGKQCQGVQSQEQRTLGCQPFVIQRVDDRHQRRRTEQAGEH
ncbi:hypothetical protein A986_09870 [Pseudomonas fluorescens BRIP34879]|nr:hypothetical protein A986_09870 [Pseudomonas fluorescens BRIP34879]